MSKTGTATFELGLPAKITLLLIAPLSALATGGLPPVLPMISAHFSGEPSADALVRVLVTSVGGAIIFGAPLGGLLADKFGYRNFLLLSLLLFAIAGTSGFVIDDLTLLIVSRIVLGLAVAGVGVVGPAVFATYVQQSERWMGYWASAGTASALLIIPLAGAIGAIDWRSVFLLHLFAVPLLALTLITIPRLKSDATRAVDSGEPVNERTDQSGIAGVAFRLALLGLASGVVGTSGIIYLPYHMVAAGIGSPGEIATAMMPSIATSLTTAFFYGLLRRYLSISGTFVIAFTLNCLGNTVIATSTDIAGIFAGGAINGIGIGVLAPNLFTLAGELAKPEWRARIIGVSRAGFFGGPLLFQIPFEVAVASYGPSSALFGLALISGAAAIFLLYRNGPAARLRPA